jgi:hypothetical protein
MYTDNTAVYSIGLPLYSPDSLPRFVVFTALTALTLSSPKSNCSLFVLWSAVRPAVATAAVGSGAYAVAPAAGSCGWLLVSGWLPVSDVTAEWSFLVLGGRSGGGLVLEEVRRGNCWRSAGFSCVGGTHRLDELVYIVVRW